jgi:Fe-S cluster assembly iron-binding protein IscA
VHRHTPPPRNNTCNHQRLKQLQAEAPPGADRVMLRVEVEGGGCSGFQYKFRLDTTKPSADDL